MNNLKDGAVVARRIRYGKGKGSIEIDGIQRELFEKALRDVAPMTVFILEGEMDERVEYAKKNWIVRGDRPVERNGRIRIEKQQSERSVDKFSTGFRIVQGGKAVEAFFGNDAQYAWAIEAADYSKRDDGSPSTIPTGGRVAEVTMWKPARAGLPKLIEKLADAYVKEQKKVK
jgi:hypothetical protein